MNKEDIIIKKLEEHDVKLAEHDGQFGVIVSKLVEHDTQLTNIVSTLATVVGKVDVLETKVDALQTMTEQILTGQDQMMGILTRLDQERLGATARLDRFEDRFEKLETKPRAA